MLSMANSRVILGDALDPQTWASVADGSVHCIATSPPYLGLRLYQSGAGEVGRERTIEEYVGNLLAVFRLARRVLRDDGTLWVNLGSSFCSQIEDDQEYELRPGLGEAEVAEVLAGLSAMRE